MAALNLQRRWLLCALVVLCTARTSVSTHAAEFLPDLLLEDPRPQAPFAHEVEVTVRPVMATQTLDEVMAATVTMKNLSPGNVALPHGWGNNYLWELRIEVDRGFATRHGIHVRECGAISIAAPIRRLSSNQTAHATIDLGCYLTFTKPVRPPVPVTWRIVLRTGEEKRGHFLLHIQLPNDTLEDVMEQHRREQDKYLPSLIELPPWPISE